MAKKDKEHASALDALMSQMLVESRHRASLLPKGREGTDQGPKVASVVLDVVSSHHSELIEAARADLLAAV